VATEETRPTKRVLIVDDEPMVRGLLRDVFNNFEHAHAYEVMTEPHADDALATLQRERFDLILLDTHMPRMRERWDGREGLDLLRQIRAIGVDAPVIMMTGYPVSVPSTDSADARIDDAVGYLFKPFNMHELERAVVGALGSGPGAAGTEGLGKEDL
jgi:two-component system response regulator (stage 0 sporulation protein F)